MSHSSNSRIGFISTRLAGTDGVSLETAKWANVLAGAGHECFYFAGELDQPEERAYRVPEAHFMHPEIRSLNTDLFDDNQRSPDTSQRVSRLQEHLKLHLYRFIRRFKPELLVIENALSLPMNIPLGLALTEVIAETCLPAVAHHHDFYWERQRYAINAAEDYLRSAFPPTLGRIHHVVINSYARQQLALRTGLSSSLIPNVMDFESAPPGPDGYALSLRGDLGLSPDTFLLLQPTRIVPRKRIEIAIELARRLELDCTLLVTHQSGDEGQAYEAYLREYTSLLGARVIFAADRFAPRRGQSWEGNRVYSLADAYQEANLVTYPSRVEGFGNAFLEAVYYRRPVVMSMYEIFKTDIQPKGFQVISFDSFIDQACLDQVRRVLHEPHLAAAMTEHNYKIGKRHYSYQALERRLKALMDSVLGE